jgi:drug/metabolite transporter (DMT)-like permease
VLTADVGPMDTETRMEPQRIDRPGPIRPADWGLLGLSLALQVTAVVFGKLAALEMPAFTFSAFVTSPLYLSVLALLALQALCWQVVLRRIPLVVAYPFTSLNYLLILGASRVFFEEPISVFNVVGSVVIIVGVCLVVQERPV